jgi:hypothetical protein
VAFQLVCACGQPVAGQRRRQHQVIACPSCKQTRFVLPLSPWPDGHGGATGVAISPGRARRPLGYRLVGAGMAALAVMGVLYLGMWPFDSSGPQGGRGPGADNGRRAGAGRG